MPRSRRRSPNSEELRQLTTSPVISRDEAARASAAVAKAMKLDPLTTRFLGVLAQNRRLAQLGNVIRAFNPLAAAHRGEVTAQVTTAHPLTTTRSPRIKIESEDPSRPRRRG